MILWVIFRCRDPEWGQVKRSCCWPWPCPVLLSSGQSEARIWGQLTNDRPGWGKSASPDAGMMLNTESQWWIISSKINDWTKACIGWHLDQRLPSYSDNFIDKKHSVTENQDGTLRAPKVLVTKHLYSYVLLGCDTLRPPWDLHCNLWLTLCW